MRWINRLEGLMSGETQLPGPQASHLLPATSHGGRGEGILWGLFNTITCFIH